MKWLKEASGRVRTWFGQKCLLYEADNEEEEEEEEKLAALHIALPWKAYLLQQTSYLLRI